MKKLMMVAFLLSGAMMSQATNTNENTSIETPAGGSLKILNDTDDEVRIHTGTGVVTLQKNGSTSISCEVGKEIRTAPNGTKKDLLFEVEESMCGTTVKLSKYL